MRPAIGEARIKGGIFRSHLDWVKTHHGDDGLARVLGALPSESAAQMAAPLASSWYPYEMLIELDAAIEQMFGASVSVLPELGRHSARLNLETTYRAFRRQTPHEFFERSTPLHRQYQDFGDVKYERTGERSGRIVFSGLIAWNRIYCASAVGYFAECIRIHGGAGPRVSETECRAAGGTRCVYELQWV